MIVVLLTHPERDMHSVLYAFPSRVIFLWFIQKFDDFCYLLPGVEVGKLY